MPFTTLRFSLLATILLTITVSGRSSESLGIGQARASPNEPASRGRGDLNAEARVDEVFPAPNATEVDRQIRINLRFSLLIDPKTLNEQTIVLIGPEGPVLGAVTSLGEGGSAIFVPNNELNPGAHYDLLVSGGKTRAGKSLTFWASSFTTARALATTNVSTARSDAATFAGTPSAGEEQEIIRAHCPVLFSGYCRQKGVVEDGRWLPGSENLGGHWKVNGFHPPVPSSRLLRGRNIPAKSTGVYGQVLRVDDTPVSGVTVSTGGIETRTDANGVFVLSNLSAGHQVVMIDGSSANVVGAEYGSFPVGVEVRAGVVSGLPQVLYLPRIQNEDKIQIASPTTKETVLTHPEIPGLEIHIPANTVIRDVHGRVLTELAIVPMPADRAPVPLPGNFPVFFSLQPGGAVAQTLTPNGAAGVSIVYPYDAQAASGQKTFDFWLYDAEQGAWQVYAKGHPSDDRRRLLADTSFGPISFMPGGYTVGGPRPPGVAPPPGSCGYNCDINPKRHNRGSGGAGGSPDCVCTGGADSSGDPVDSGTGLFLLHRVDLAIDDVMPIRAGRTYRSAQPTASSFGPGATLNYAMYLYSPSGQSAPQAIDLVLADGSTIPFGLISGNLSNGGPGLWQNTTVPGRFEGATLTNNEHSGLCGLCIRTKDGTTYVFSTNEIGFNYLGQGNTTGLQRVIDRYGNALILSYSGSQIVQVTSPSGRYIQLAYDTVGNVSQMRDHTGRTVSYAYDGSGMLHTVTFPDATTEVYTYDANGNMLTAVDRRGTTVFTNQYNTSQQIVQQNLANGGIYKWSYTMSGASVVATTITDPKNVVRYVTFDAMGYPLAVTRAQGTSIAQTTSFIRGAYDKPISVTDALGRVTKIAYDSLANPTSRTFAFGTPDAATYSYTYTPDFNQIATVTDPLSHTTTLTYDSNGCLVSLADPLQNTTTFTCNAFGQPTSITDALSHTTTIQYAGYDIRSVTDPLNRTLTVTTDNVGRLTGLVNPLGYTHQVQYDTESRVVKSIDAFNRTTVVGYDGNGNVTSLTDPSSNKTQWTYDTSDRVIGRLDPLNQSESWTRDNLGSVLTHTDRKNQTTTITYDVLNRYSSVVFADSTITPTFDAGNRETQAQDTISGTSTRIFDRLNRVKQEQTSQGLVTYTYDAAGRRSQMTPASQSPVNYTYDNANRLTQITQGSETVAIGYDAAGRRTSVTLPNGVITSYTYDNANELTAIVYRNASGTVLSQITYTYDGDGRRASRSGGFLADPAPVAGTGTDTFDSNNEQTAHNGTTFTYDANGNLTGDGVNTYAWDARDRLLQIKQGATVSASFAYDSANRRVSKTLGAVTTNYLYDGINAVQETNGSTVASVLMGLGADERYARSEPGGRRYYLTDALGSTLALTDSSNAVQATYSYDPYGQVNSSGTTDNPYQFTGRENDGNGFYFYRARYYSPALHRFASSDPLRLVAGINTYAYVDGNPLQFIDPKGRELLMAAIGAVVGGIVNGVNSYSSGGSLLGGIVVGALAGGLAGLINNPWAAGAIYGALSTGLNRNALGVQASCNPLIDYGLGIGLGALGAGFGAEFGGLAKAEAQIGAVYETEFAGQQLGMADASLLTNDAVNTTNYFRDNLGKGEDCGCQNQ